MDHPTPDICRAILCSFAWQLDNTGDKPRATVVSPEMYRAVADLVGFENRNDLDAAGLQRAIDTHVARYWGLPPMRVDPRAHIHARLEYE